MKPGTDPLRVRVAPHTPPEVELAVREAGARLVPAADGADVLVWLDADPTEVRAELADTVRWVQLPAAGVEPWIRSGLVTGDRTWLSAAGAYADHVAEHAVASLLAIRHRLHEHARATSWQQLAYSQLGSRRVLVVGAGGIGRVVVRRLDALGAVPVVALRRPSEVPGASRTVATGELARERARVDDVVITVPATPETAGLIGEAALRALPADAAVVNVGRGEVLDTAGLLRVLDDGHLAGAALDVVDPEPLPAGHALWRHPRVLVTSHSANPTSLRWPALARRVSENLRRIADGAEPLGVIDTHRGY